MIKNKLVVNICGQEYTLVGVESQEYMQKVSLYVDKKMTELNKLNNKLSTSMTAVLTALNVADELAKSKENEGLLKSQLAQSLKDIERLRGELKKQLLSSKSIEKGTRDYKKELA